MKNKSLKLIIMFLALFCYTFLINSDKSYAIYKETKSTDIYLNIVNPSGATVIFNGNGGTPSEGSRSVAPNSEVGTLPTATQTGYNFIGWFTDPTNGVEVNKNMIVPSGTTNLYAHWQKIVCIYAAPGTLHSERCAQGSNSTENSQGCRAQGLAGQDIEYGNIVDSTTLDPGDALDCDVGGHLPGCAAGSGAADIGPSPQRHCPAGSPKEPGPGDAVGR